MIPQNFKSREAPILPVGWPGYRAIGNHPFWALVTLNLGRQEMNHPYSYLVP
jgi:hypothetical protein